MSMMEKFLQITRSTLQPYTGEETLSHDNDSEKQVVDEETLRRAKFNSEYEDAKKRASEVKMKKKMTKVMKLQQMVRCNETNLQLYQRNRTNNQNRPKIICFACHKQSIQVGRSE